MTDGAVLTACVRTSEVLPLKFVSPPYSAVIECEPAVSEEVEKVVCPVPSKVPLPMTLAPSLKSTLPVGVPEAGGLAATVAVKVTD